MRIKIGDTVKVLYGKYAGKTGKVLRILRKKNTLVVEGVNKVKKHVKGDGQKKESAIVTITLPMPISKVQLIVDGKPTRVKYEGTGDKKVRVAVKTGKKVDTVTEKKAAKKTEAKSAPKKKAVKKAEPKKETKKKSTTKNK